MYTQSFPIYLCMYWFVLLNYTFWNSARNSPWNRRSLLPFTPSPLSGCTTVHANYIGGLWFETFIFKKGNIFKRAMAM